MTFFDDVGKFWSDSQKNVNKFMDDAGDWYGKTNKDVQDFFMDRFYNVRDVVDTYKDVVDDGINPQDYKPWQSLLPFVDKLQVYHDKRKQFEDYYAHTGKWPAYTSSLPTFGSAGQLANGLLGEARRGLYAVGRLSKRL
ncbi:MAG: hypothetical protein [Macaque stool associated virus 12]|nr:MAG: hypothetical protein [Macaque stool associated virus 12]